MDLDYNIKLSFSDHVTTEKQVQFTFIMSPTTIPFSDVPNSLWWINNEEKQQRSPRLLSLSCSADDGSLVL